MSNFSQLRLVISSVVFNNFIYPLSVNNSYIKLKETYKEPPLQYFCHR